MQFSYSFLEHSASHQFKDMAFLEMLKRKGPYIERSLTKIQNDLFYRHKLPGSQMKNLTFIKQIRLTLSAYEVLVNEIRNDFSMTQLDSLGDSIHKMFSQMISIINFFVAVVLKKEKLAIDELREMSLEQVREKEAVAKKHQQEQMAKALQQAERQKHEMFKQIQRLKFNFNSLYKMQLNSDKQKDAMEKQWASVVQQTISKAKESTMIKDSELQKIIKDSCEYMYKNHSELERIVRLTKQDITQVQKSIDTFGEQRNLLQLNDCRIQHMKQLAKKLVHFVRDKVYDRTQVMVQTDCIQDDGSNVLMTTKELDEKRRAEIKMRIYERQMKEKDHEIKQIDMKLKQAELRLKKVLQYSNSQQSEQRHINYDALRLQSNKRTVMGNNSHEISTNFLNLPKSIRNKKQKNDQVPKQKIQQHNSFTIISKSPAMMNANLRSGSFISANINHSNNKSKRVDSSNNDKKEEQLSQIVNDKVKSYVVSQHEVMDQKTSNRLSQSTCKDGIMKNFKQRRSVYSEEKMKSIVPISIVSSKLHQQKSQKQQVVEKNSQLQESHQVKEISRISKKFYKMRKSLLEVKSFQEMSRAFMRSRQNAIDSESDNSPKQQQLNTISKVRLLEIQSKIEKPQNLCDDVSIENIEISQQKEKMQKNTSSVKNSQEIFKVRQLADPINKSNVLPQQIKQSQQQSPKKKKTPNLTLNHTMKIIIRPFFIKRYIQSTYNHPVTQQKSRQIKNKHSQLNTSINEIQKIKKSNSQLDPQKYCFESLDIGVKPQEVLPNRKQAKMKFLLNNENKMMVSSFSGDLKISQSPNLLGNKQNVQQPHNSDKPIISRVNTINFMGLKNQEKLKCQSLEKNQQNIMNYRIQSPLQCSHSGQKQRQTNLKKSSIVRQNATFYLGSRIGESIKTSKFKA